MIIGIDASRAFINKKTGTENYSFQILSNLLSIDQTNNYKIYLRPGGQPSTLQLPISITHNNQFITIPYPKLWTQVGLALQTFKDRSLDLLFVPSHTLPLVRKPGLKTVVTVHDLGAEYLPQTHQLKQRLYLKLMTDYQLKTATKIIAVSEATKNDLVQKVGISPDKIKVIYEGYNQELFNPQKSDVFLSILNHYDLVQGNYFLFVGTVQPRKNIKRLINAYATYLKKARGQPKLVLAGGKGWLSDDIYKLPIELGIKDHVKFLGYVPDNHLPSLYQGAIAFLFPSLFEGFGLPVLEAFACGCPVLTSNTSSLPEVAGNAALLVNPFEEIEISDGITKLFINPKLRKDLTQKGLNQVKNFSWKKAAKEHLKLFQSLSHN